MTNTQTVAYCRFNNNLLSTVSAALYRDAHFLKLLGIACIRNSMQKYRFFVALYVVYFVAYFSVCKNNDLMKAHIKRSFRY